MLTRHEAEIRHELARCFEASPIHEFSREHHGGMCLNASEAAKPSNRSDEGRAEGERLDLRIEIGATPELVLQQGEQFAKDDGIFRRECSRALEHVKPRHVTLRPMIARAIDEAPAREELQ